VVFAHIPLWPVYPEWGWGTEDSARALGYLKKFGSVTVLNGRSHQTLPKLEGKVTFHTAASTAFPQPQPGKADSPGPLKVPADQLRSVLAITDVNYIQGQHALAVVDSTLAYAESKQISIRSQITETEKIMRRNAYVAGLAAALVLAVGMLATSQRSFMASAAAEGVDRGCGNRQLQLRASGADRPGRNHDDVDQPR